MVKENIGEFYFPYNDVPQRVDEDMDFVDEKPNLESIDIKIDLPILDQKKDYTCEESARLDSIKLEPIDSDN